MRFGAVCSVVFALSLCAFACAGLVSAHAVGRTHDSGDGDVHRTAAADNDQPLPQPLQLLEQSARSSVTAASGVSAWHSPKRGGRPQRKAAARKTAKAKAAAKRGGGRKAKGKAKKPAKAHATKTAAKRKGGKAAGKAAAAKRNSKAAKRNAKRSNAKAANDKAKGKARPKTAKTKAKAKSATAKRFNRSAAKAKGKGNGKSKGRGKGKGQGTAKGQKNGSKNSPKNVAKAGTIKSAKIAGGKTASKAAGKKGGGKTKTKTGANAVTGKGKGKGKGTRKGSKASGRSAKSNKTKAQKNKHNGKTKGAKHTAKAKAKAKTKAKAKEAKAKAKAKAKAQTTKANGKTGAAPDGAAAVSRGLTPLGAANPNANAPDKAAAPLKSQPPNAQLPTAQPPNGAAPNAEAEACCAPRSGGAARFRQLMRMGIGRNSANARVLRDARFRCKDCAQQQTADAQWPVGLNGVCTNPDCPTKGDGGKASTVTLPAAYKEDMKKRADAGHYKLTPDAKAPGGYKKDADHNDLWDPRYPTQGGAPPASPEELARRQNIHQQQLDDIKNKKYTQIGAGGAAVKDADKMAAIYNEGKAPGDQISVDSLKKVSSSTFAGGGIGSDPNDKRTAATGAPELTMETHTVVGTTNSGQEVVLDAETKKKYPQLQHSEATSDASRSTLPASKKEKRKIDAANRKKREAGSNAPSTSTHPSTTSSTTPTTTSNSVQKRSFDAMNDDPPSATPTPASITPATTTSQSAENEAKRKRLHEPSEGNGDSTS